MNDMSAVAHDRLIAQIAEALFGQPGMSLMEMANRRGEIEAMRDEGDRLKRVKEIVAKTRRSNSDAYEQACQNDDCRTQAVCNARTSLLNNIDAAMKEQAE